MQRSQPTKASNKLNHKNPQNKKTIQKTPKRSIKTTKKSSPQRVTKLRSTQSASFSTSTDNDAGVMGLKFEFLDVQRKGPTIQVTMNRPDLHNAFNEHVISELTTVFKQIGKDVDTFVAKNPVADSNPNGLIRSVVLTGAGKSFSAGADLNWMKKMSQYSQEENKQDSLALYDMFKSIYDCPVPVIARVNGVALGGGAGLVAVADIAVATEQVLIGFTEVGIGLVPAVISRFCGEKIGTAAAARYFVTGERFNATEAKRIGLVHEVFDDMTKVDEQVEKLTKTINSNSPNAVRSAKKLWKEVLGGHHNLSKPETRDFTASTIAGIRVSEEGQAGLNSFLNKSPAPWKLAKPEGEQKQ
jgi:methylglutaconyl-CoA hydratase